MRGWFCAKDKERLKREEGRTIGAVKEIANFTGIWNRSSVWKHMIFPIQMVSNR